MTSPLKITLKLSGPRPPTGLSPSPIPVKSSSSRGGEDERSATGSPRKRPKTSGRSRKPKLEGTPTLDT